MTHAAPGPISMTLSAFFTSTANQNPDNLPPAKKAIMGMMKKYLLNLLTLCSDEQFGQDAVEWAIMNGNIHLTYLCEAQHKYVNVEWLVMWSECLLAAD